MSSRIGRATITVDDIARESFPQPGDVIKGRLDTIERLQKHLQDKGDHPNYDRVIFAVAGKDTYIEITDTDICLEGVFPRVSAVSHLYGHDNRVLNKTLSLNVVGTLVVADSEDMANMWETELQQLGYSMRRL